MKRRHDGEDPVESEPSPESFTDFQVDVCDYFFGQFGSQISQESSEDDENRTPPVEFENIPTTSPLSRFHTRLRHFSALCDVTDLHLDHIPWPLSVDATFIKPLTRSRHNRVNEENVDWSMFAPSSYVVAMRRLMFVYGDEPEPAEEVARYLLKKTFFNVMVYVRLMWSAAVESGESIITYHQLIPLLANNRKRLERFIRFTIGVERHKKMPLGIETETNEELLRRRKPLLVEALTDMVLREGTSLDRFLEDCTTFEQDMHMNMISSLVVHRHGWLSSTDRRTWQRARFDSFCTVNGKRSSNRAFRFHEAIGLPPLDTEIIYDIDYLAREFVMETVHLTLKKRYMNGHNMDTSLTLVDYKTALNSQREDILLGVNTVPYDMSANVLLEHTMEEELTTKRILREARQYTCMWMGFEFYDASVDSWVARECSCLEFYYEVRVYEQKHRLGVEAMIEDIRRRRRATGPKENRVPFDPACLFKMRRP